MVALSENECELIHYPVVSISFALVLCAGLWEIEHVTEIYRAPFHISP